jgi:hypothetical protein
MFRVNNGWRAIVEAVSIDADWTRMQYATALV